VATPSIRDAVSADLPAVTEIQNALLGTTTYEWTEVPYTLGQKAEWLARQHDCGHPVLVALDGDHVVGWAAYGDFRDSRRWPGYRFTVEHSVHVARSHWGRGVGRALVERLADRARHDGKRVMVAGIDSSNVDSITFHGRLGFHEVARLPGVGEKWGRRLDLVLMQRDLTRTGPPSAEHGTLDVRSGGAGTRVRFPTPAPPLLGHRDHAIDEIVGRGL
jgi:phosphinothricin acetyltransferase